MKKLQAVILALVMVSGGFTAISYAEKAVKDNAHNLSFSGRGKVRAVSETEVCIFCHSSHSGAVAEKTPLWNRSLTSVVYTPYTSSTMDAVTGQPTGHSKLCLSCHDGTIALGSVNTLKKHRKQIALVGAGVRGEIPGNLLDRNSRSNLGTDLSNDHPVSFVFDALLVGKDKELLLPGRAETVHLYSGANPMVSDNVQCTSCHDPHEDVIGKFLKKDVMGQKDNLCLTCHLKPDWTGSSHEGSSTYFPARQKIKMVKDYSCVACHEGHVEEGAQFLLKDGADRLGNPAQEETCYVCHKEENLGGVSYDIASQFRKGHTGGSAMDLTKPGHQPIITSEPKEGVLLEPGTGSSMSRHVDTQHVECSDCHNPHRLARGNTLKGAKGIDINGNMVGAYTGNTRDPYEYEICFRCHGDTYTKVVSTPYPDNTVIRPKGGSNKKKEFATTSDNMSYHPVYAKGKNTSAALDRQMAFAGLTTTSTIGCGDCHNNDETGRVSGSASKFQSTVTSPKGPHGSVYQNILRANYSTVVGTPTASALTSYGKDNFALCYLCHDETAFTSSGTSMTNFVSGAINLHAVHVKKTGGTGGRGTYATCQECHYNTHSNVEAVNTLFMGPADGLTHLVDFGPNAAPVTGNLKPRWGIGAGNGCALKCHGSTHDTSGAIGTVNGTYD